MKPRTIVEHHTEKFLLVRPLRAMNTAAVLAAEIPRQAERHFGYAVAALPLGVVVLHQQAVVLVYTRHVGVVHGWSRSGVRPRRCAGITSILGLAVHIGSP